MEQWRDVPGYEGIYRVSNLGNVWSAVYKKAMKPEITRLGYARVALFREGKKIRHLVHTIVCSAFIGPKKSGIECNHKDGKKSNNALTNLEYVTRGQNLRHSIDVLGNSNRGELSAKSRLKASQVTEIVRLYKTGRYTAAQLGREFGVASGTISGIVNGRRWTWLIGNAPVARWEDGTRPIPGPGHKLNECSVREIRNQCHIDEGINYKQVAERYGVSVSVIKSVISGRTWKWVK